MRAYVVNLARSPDRRAHMVRELRKAGVDHEFVEGVDGRDVDLTDTSVVEPAWLGEGPFWAALVGCSSSHLKVYQRVVDVGADRALVLEDDVVLPAEMSPFIEAVSRHMSGAEVVLLHHHRYGGAERGETYRFGSDGSVHLPESRILARPTDVGELAGAGAYLITREACLRMLDLMRPVRARADDWRVFCEEGALDTVRCVVPMPVLASPRFRTTMDHFAPRSLQTRVRNGLGRVPVLREALAIRRQRLMARKTQVELVEES